MNQEQEDALDTLRRSRNLIDAAYAERRAAIIAAKAAGIPVTVIARELNLSRQRVYDVIRNIR